MAEMETPSEGSVETPLGKFAFKGKQIAEFISILCLFVTVVLATLWWQHDRNETKSDGETVSVLKEILHTQKDMASAMREQTCISAMPETERKAAYQSPYSLCKQMGRP